MPPLSERRAAHGCFPAGAGSFGVVRERRERRRGFGVRVARLGLVPRPHPGPPARQLRGHEDACAEVFEPDPRFIARHGVPGPGMDIEAGEGGKEEVVRPTSDGSEYVRFVASLFVFVVLVLRLVRSLHKRERRFVPKGRYVQPFV